jgi:hypothetical protein
MPLSIYLSDPHWRDEAVAQEGAQNSVKKRVYFGHHRSPFTHPLLTLARVSEVGVLKWHGVGERAG